MADTEPSSFSSQGLADKVPKAGETSMLWAPEGKDLVTPAPTAIGFSSSSVVISPNGTGSKVTMRTNPVSASSWSSQTLVTSVCQRLHQNIKVSVSPRLQKCCPGGSRSWLGHCGNQASLGIRMEKQLGTPDSHDLSVWASPLRTRHWATYQAHCLSSVLSSFPTSSSWIELLSLWLWIKPK